MRLVMLVVVFGCDRGGAPSPSPSPPPTPAPAARLELPRADAAAAVKLDKADPVAVVLVGPTGALSIGAWEGGLPSATEPLADVAAVEAAIVKRAQRGSAIAQDAAVKWTDRTSPLREWRDKVGELEQEAHFAIQRRYFGHFPAGLDPRRTEENELPTWGQVGRHLIARADTADRVPPLAPLIASAPGAPALPTVRIATTIGGAIGVSLDGAPGVLRKGFRWAIDVPPGYDDGKTWVEVRASARGLEVIDLRAPEVRSVPWDKVGSLAGVLGTPAPAMVDVLVTPELTAQQLVDTLSALRDVRWTNLAEAPAGTAAERLAQLRAVRLARRMDERVSLSDVYVDGHLGDEADAIKAALAPQLPALAACYDARRPQMAKPEGFVGLVFALGPGRKLAKLRVDSDDDQLAVCMRGVVEGTAFPAFKVRQDVSGALELEAPELHD